MTPDQCHTAATAPEAVQLALPLDREASRASQGWRSIETDFPILEVSQLAQLESYRKNIHRPVYYTRRWWARRLGSEAGRKYEARRCKVAKLTLELPLEL